VGVKLSTTLEQLLRLVVEPGEEASGDDDRRGEPTARVQSRPDPLPASVSRVDEEEPWRARYTPAPENAADEPNSPEPWEARFTPEAPQPAPAEAQAEAAAEPEEPAPQASFEPDRVAAAEPEPEPEPAPETVAPPAVQHAPAPERGRLEQLEAAVSVAESLNLGLHLGLAVERIAMAATQGSEGVGALEEASWLIDRYVSLLEKRPIGADLHQSAARLARTGDAIQDMKELASAFRTEPDPDEPGRIRRLSE